MKRSKKITIAMVILTVILAICLAVIGGIWILKNLPDNSEYDVHLYVSNQSVLDDPVNLSVSVGGDEKFNDTCFSDLLHNWTRVDFTLRNGEYLFYAIEMDHSISKDRKIEINSEVWIVVEYWYRDEFFSPPSDREITIKEYDSPIVFQ